jgi:hypothetical protein
MTVTDAFKPVTRYWDRITRPEQIIRSLPQALAVMLDPATRGPAFIALPQDIQAEAYDYPAVFFEPQVHYIRRPSGPADVEAAAILLGGPRPLIIAGGASTPGAVDTVRRSSGTASGRRRSPQGDVMTTRTATRTNGSKAANAVAARRRRPRRTAVAGLHDGSWALFDIRTLVSVNTAG